jgi:hypothetical protein
MPSTTKPADLVLQYYGAAGHGGRSRLWLFNDGRLIVQLEGRIPSGPAAGTEGYVERCLSRSGVAKMHTYVLTTAPNSVDTHPVPTLRVRVGVSLVDFAPGRMDPDHLFEPETWLQDVDFIDRRYRPYVPTTYSFCSTPSSNANAASPVVDKLPSRAVEVLGTRPWSVWKVPTPEVSCATITADEARELVGIIDEAWFQQDYDGPPYVLDVGLHRRETQNPNWDSATYVGIEPVMPDGQFTCNCG